MPITNVTEDIRLYAQWVGIPDGSAGRPFLVYDDATLRQVGTGIDGWTLSVHYRQTQSFAVTNDLFTPIGWHGNSGTDANQFTGSYDGGVYTISNLKISRTSNHTGLFGALGAYSTSGSGSSLVELGLLKNIHLINPEISGGDYTGSLLGSNNGGRIVDSTVTMSGSSSVQGTTNVGGLVGYNNLGTITDSSITMSGSASITGTGTGTTNSHAGGLVGSNYMGTIIDSNATVTDVSVTAGAGDEFNPPRFTTGGLVGRNEGGTITNVTVNIQGSNPNGSIRGYRRVGGLAGYASLLSSSGTITNSNVIMTSTASVRASQQEAGGLVGFASNVHISGSSVGGGTVRGGGSVGGLVGQFTGTSSDIIENCYTNTTVELLPSSIGYSFGGLVGSSIGPTIRNCYAIGDVTGYNYVGGLVGDNRGPISNSFAEGDVTGNNTVGGLAGYNSGAITNTYATGDVKADGTSGTIMAGGLVGQNEAGTVRSNYATGNVTGSTSGTVYIGGIVGQNIGTGQVQSNVALNPSVIGNNARRVAYGIPSTFVLHNNHARWMYVNNNLIYTPGSISDPHGDGYSLGVAATNLNDLFNLFLDIPFWATVGITDDHWNFHSYPNLPTLKAISVLVQHPQLQ